MSSNLLRRIDRIEDLLGGEPSRDKLSPTLQEAVDRIVRREPPLKDLGKTERKVDQPLFRRQPEKLSPCLQASIDRLEARVKRGQEGDEKDA